MERGNVKAACGERRILPIRRTLYHRFIGLDVPPTGDFAFCFLGRWDSVTLVVANRPRKKKSENLGSKRKYCLLPCVFNQFLADFDARGFGKTVGISHRNGEQVTEDPQDDR
jgi:hypothetical protein